MEGKTKKIIIGVTIAVALLLIGTVVALVATRDNTPENNTLNNNVVEDDSYVDVEPITPGDSENGDSSQDDTNNEVADGNNTSSGESSGNGQYEIYYETVTREEIIEAFELNVGWSALNLGLMQNVATDIYAPQLLITKKLVKASDIANVVNEVNVDTHYYYVIEAINSGNYVAKDVVITDEIDRSFLVSNDEGKTFSADRNISLPVGDIAPQSKVRVNILVKLNAAPGEHSKLTVKPGETILNVAYADGSNILKRPSNKVETIFKLLTSDVTINHIYNDREKTSEDTEIVADVEIGTSYTAQARDEANYTSTGDKTIEVIDGENIINIYYTRKLTDVVVNHIYDDREETAEDTETVEGLKVGDKYTAKVRNEINYTSTGDTTVELVDGENIVNIYYTRKYADVIVNHIYDDREETAGDTEKTPSLKVGTEYIAKARNEANYTSTGDKTIEVRDGQNVVNIYYTRKLTDVTVKHIYNDREETAEDLETATGLKVGDSFTGIARDEANYTSAGNQTITLVDGENVIEIHYTRKLVDVKVNHIYNDREETPNDTETVKDVKVGTSYTGLARNEANYTTTGNQTIEVIDGENVINIYYTRKLTDVTVKHIYNDREETAEDLETATDLKVGDSFTGLARNEANYTSTGDKTITLVDGENVIEIHYTRKLVDVKVNHIYNDREETPNDTETVKDVKVGTSYTGVARNEANYTTTGNQTIEVIDGKNEINIYYTRKLTNVVVNHIYDDREQTESDKEIALNVKVGDKYTGVAREDVYYSSTGNKTITLAEGENIINIYYTRLYPNFVGSKTAVYDPKTQTITYTITVENNGDAPGVTSASDDLNVAPSNVYTYAESIKILPTSEDVTRNGSVIEWNNISLNKGESKSIKFAVKLKNTVTIGTAITNKGSVGETQITLAEQDIKLTSKSVKLVNKNVILVIDISGSMTSKNKLPNALNAARSFINEAFAEGNNCGITMTLISFSGKATTWADCVSTKEEALNAVDVLEAHGNEWGTRMDLGLFAAAEAMGKLETLNGNDTILVFLGDGAPTGGSTPNTPEYLIKTADLLKTKLQALYTIGFDVAAGSSTANLLKNMSSMNKVYISGIDELEGIFTTIAHQILNKEITQTTNNGIFIYKDSVNGIAKSHKIKVTVGSNVKEYASVDALPEEFTFNKETNTLVWDVTKYSVDTVLKIEYFLK